MLRHIHVDQFHVYIKYYHYTIVMEFEFKEIKYVPGLYKIFDEIIVNAADNFSRQKYLAHSGIPRTSGGKCFI